MAERKRERGVEEEQSREVAGGGDNGGEESRRKGIGRSAWGMGGITARRMTLLHTRVRRTTSISPKHG